MEIFLQLQIVIGSKLGRMRNLIDRSSLGTLLLQPDLNESFGEYTTGSQISMIP